MCIPHIKKSFSLFKTIIFLFRLLFFYTRIFHSISICIYIFPIDRACFVYMALDLCDKGDGMICGLALTMFHNSFLLSFKLFTIDFCKTTPNVRSRFMHFRVWLAFIISHSTWKIHNFLPFFCHLISFLFSKKWNEGEFCTNGKKAFFKNKFFVTNWNRIADECVD